MTHTYYKVKITLTSKKPFSKDDYRTFDKFEKNFSILAQAKLFLEEQYGTVKKRVKMHRDTKDGGSTHCGWIYCFKNKDWSHATNWWLQQDWVEIKEVTEEVVI